MSDIQAKTATIGDQPEPMAMQLRDVAVSFNGRTAVRDCSFDIVKNRVTSLIGPSGSARRRCCAP